MGRTIVQTETPGWYDDPATGKKTRKQDGDVIMTDEQYRQAKRDAEDEAAVTDNGKPAAAQATERMRENAKSAAKAEAPKVKLTSGKSVTGETVTIHCSHIEGKDHDKPWKKLSPKEREQACGKERVIKKQDEFQVKRCPEHQKAHRNALRRRKTAQRRRQRETASK